MRGTLSTNSRICTSFRTAFTTLPSFMSPHCLSLCLSLSLSHTLSLSMSHTARFRHSVLMDRTLSCVPRDHWDHAAWQPMAPTSTESEPHVHSGRVGITLPLSHTDSLSVSVSTTASLARAPRHHSYLIHLAKLPHLTSLPTRHTARACE